MEYKLNIIKSNRKTISIQVSSKELVTVRMPMCATQADLNQTLKASENWIQKHLALAEERARQRGDLPRFTSDEIKAMADKALEVIPERVRFYAPKIGVSYGNITIRNQKSRWGSCSSRGNLNFNCLLVNAPMSVIDYVVVHELCHRVEMNHSAKFWALVESILPSYRKEIEWLNMQGSVLIERMLG